MAASTRTTMRSEVGWQTGLCGQGEGNACTELEEGQTCLTREQTHEDGSTTACNDEVGSSMTCIVLILNPWPIRAAWSQTILDVVCGRIHNQSMINASCDLVTVIT